MKPLAAAALAVLAVAAGGQSSAPAREQILQNPRVTAFLVDLSGGALTSTEKHPDMLTVFVGDQEMRTKDSAGLVSFTPAGTREPQAKASRSAQRAVQVEFAEPQGHIQPEKPRSSRYCNPGSKTACVAEKYLFCTAKACVEDVTMGPGAITTKHSHETDHMIVAITDYSLSDDVVGKGVTMRNVKSGGVEYSPAGITHTLTNKSAGEIRFVVVVFR